MSQKVQKRNRSINWDEEEKQLFRFVLKDYAAIIENKSLDTNTNKIKNNAWEKVHEKFNQLNSRPRELSQLKIQWKAMKVNARKTFSTYKKEVKKTGGGTRPATPNDAVIEVKDLLNPAELLIDHNIYDSDGVIVGELKPTATEICPVKLQDSNLRDSNIENEQIANMQLETVEDIDEPVTVQELTSLLTSDDEIIVKTPMKRKKSTSTKKTSEDEIIVETPMNRNKSTTSTKKVGKQKILINKVLDSSMKPKKDHEDYINSMLSHSKMLKDEEHMRRMEIADEEHKMKMQMAEEERKMKMEEHKMKMEEHKMKTEEHEMKIEEHKMKIEERKIKIETHREKLKAAIFERETSEFKKAHEAL